MPVHEECPIPNSSPRAARRRLSPESRRRELIDAATIVLGRLGEPGCRVEDVTAAAGTAKGNFYRYFATWEDLLSAVRAQVLAGYALDAERRSAGLAKRDSAVALEHEANAFIDFQLAMGELREIVFHGRAARDRGDRDADQPVVRAIGALVEAGVADGTFARVDVDAIARLIFHTLCGAADEIAAGNDERTVRAAALRLLTRGLIPPSVTS